MGEDGPINAANDCERTSARLTETFPTKGMTRKRRPHKRQRGRREEEGNEERREWTDSVYRGKQLKKEQRRRNAERAEKTMRRRMTMPHVAYRWFALKAHTLTCPRLSYAVAENPIDGAERTSSAWGLTDYHYATQSLGKASTMKSIVTGD
jgi:hypothetical protein